MQVLFLYLDPQGNGYSETLSPKPQSLNSKIGFRAYSKGFGTPVEIIISAKF